MHKFVIANWKAHKTVGEATQWVHEFEKFMTDRVHAQKTGAWPRVVVAPSLLHVSLLQEFSKRIQYSNFFVGAQDVSPFPDGAYTGATTARMARSSGVRYALVGHSERRRYFHETHQDIARKVSLCLEEGIVPIVCVDDEYIVEQAAALDRSDLSRVIVAYEELGSIGTGVTEPLIHVQEVVETIKYAFGLVPVLYGGSVKPHNATEYVSITDGVLVGSASLSASDFGQIVMAACQE
jgi:triosephosphate isomerase